MPTAKKHLAIYLITLAFAIGTGLLVAINDVAVKSGDPIELMQNAENIWHYDSKYWPPLYSAVVAGLDLLVGDVFLSGKIVSWLFSIAVVLLTYVAGMVCFKSSKIGLLAAVLVALTPLIIRHSYLVGTDSMGAALFLASSCILGVSGTKPRTWVFLAGLVAGLAFLTRYNFVGLAPAGLFFIILVQPGSVGEKFRAAAGFLAGFCVVAVPWAALNIARFGDLHSMTHTNIAFAMFDETDSWLQWEKYEQQYPTLISLIVAHPIELTMHLARNLLHFPTEIVLKVCHLAGAVAILGLTRALRNPSRERVALLLNSLTMVAVTSLTWLESRFFVWALPAIFLFGAYSLLVCLPRTLSTYIPSGWARAVPVRSALIALSIAIAVLFCLLKVPKDFESYNIDDEKKAGLFLRENTPTDAAVMYSSPNLAWYADRRYLPMYLLGVVQPSDLASEVAKTDADVFVFAQRHSTWTHPQLEFLLNPQDSLVPPSWRLLYKTDGDYPVAAYWVSNRTTKQDPTDGALTGRSPNEP